jgi:hypothetical protein
MSGRGRGKRGGAKAATTATATATASTTTETIDNEVKEEKPKKISKKKQFPIVAVVGPDGIEGNLLPEVKRPLIVHLPLQSKDISMNDMPITYDPHPPTEAIPYDSNADNPFYEGVEQVENMATVAEVETASRQEMRQAITAAAAVASGSTVSNTVQESEIDYYNLKANLLVQFKESTEVKTIPQTSEVACFWCCHTFTNRPVVLPVRDTGEYLQVMGNFCSPECACAYLFDMRQDSHTRWEQLALLYRIYSGACSGKIHPAPARAILKLFGGNLSITEYRALLRSHKVRVDIHLPPMVSILATMDTKPIDFYDAGLTKGVTETVKERLHKAETELRLRRTKPLKAWESTLDACINLKIRA